MAFNKRIIPFACILPILFYMIISMCTYDFDKAGVFTDTHNHMLLFYYIIYIIYVPILESYSSMSVVRFIGSLRLIGHFYAKIIPYTLFFLIYNAASYFVISVILKLPFDMLSIIKYLLFTFAAMLIINLLCTALGMKYGLTHAKISAIVLVTLIYCISRIMQIGQDTVKNCISMLCIFKYPSLNLLGVPEVAMIPAVYGLYIFALLGIYHYSKRDWI